MTNRAFLSYHMEERLFLFCKGVGRLKRFAIIGGDSRQARLCGLLAQDGHQVSAFALERCSLPPQVRLCASAREVCKEADCVILPMPLSRGQEMLNAPLAREALPVSDVIAAVEAGTLVCGGAVDQPTQEAAVRQGVRLVDYFEREELAVLNAVPTAEGAIQIAMQELPVTISGSRCLVIGNGRIGQALHVRLRGLNADVSVAARKKQDLARIAAAGGRPVRIADLEDVLGGFDVIFNTAPALVLGKPQLRRVRKDALIIDLASRPGGVDFDHARQLGLRVNWALSLPGKVAPLTSARIIRDTIINIMEEEGK